MEPPKQTLLKPIKPQRGRPLYISARDAVRAAIESGVFAPGQQIPSTKDLSEQLAVSLVTAHRALQELVANGVLERSQGRGTFVHQRYRDRLLSGARVGLVLDPDASLCDLYYSQILEGIRQSARRLAVDLVLLRYGEDVRNECHGFLIIDPQNGHIEQHLSQSRRKPTLVVGATPDSPLLRSVTVDNVELARKAAAHLANLGHRRIGFVAADQRSSAQRDRFEGFITACHEYAASPRPQHVIRALGPRLAEREQLALVRMLRDPQRPTAIFAAGFELALGVYAAAASAGLRIPHDLSVVGVDDPPSAAHITPPLTTLRQPLVELGDAALSWLLEQIQGAPAHRSYLRISAELIIRRSTSMPVVAVSENVLV